MKGFLNHTRLSIFGLGSITLERRQKSNQSKKQGELAKDRDPLNEL